jgi:hypothetical protein
MDLTEIWWEVVNWIFLAQFVTSGVFLVNTVLNLRVP